MRRLRQTKVRLVLALLAASLVSLPAAAAKKAKGKVKKAKAAPVVKHDPEARKLMAQGLGELERGESSAAISSFNKAVRRQGSVSSYFLLGWAHYQRGFKNRPVEAADRDDAQSAIDAYTMALSLDPTLRDLPEPDRLHFSLALCHEAVGAWAQALDEYKAAFRLAPSKALIPLHAARLRLKMKDPTRAVANVELAVDKAMRLNQGKELRAAARRDPAFGPLLADAGARRALGVGSDEDGRAIAALDARGEELRDSIRDTAPKPAAPAQDPVVLDKIAQGNVEFKARRFLAAIAFYDEALAVDQERLTLGTDQVAQLYERIGTAYNKLGQAETAIGSLQQSLKKAPLNPSARYQLALAYGMSGKTASALAALREAFQACATPSDTRRVMLQAKTDSELEAVRDLPGFRSLVAEYASRVALR